MRIFRRAMLVPLLKDHNGFNYKIDLPGMSISHELIFKAQIRNNH
jgi:hypothetical protein